MIDMASIRSKNTRPEITVRRLIHGLGYRFRLHRADLPGSPDIVLPSRRKVIFVHGCFWHRHTCKWGCKVPPGNPDYWRAKFERNVARDARNREALKQAGWKHIIVWECEVKDISRLQHRLMRFLNSGQPTK